MFKRFALLAALACTVMPPAAVMAQPLINKTITIVVPFPPGGVADASARIIAQKLSENTKQSVLVDNKPGASGQIAASFVKRAAPDGTTLFLANSGSHAANAALYSKLSYDPEKDFDPIGGMVKIPQLLVVPANSAAKTVEDLIAMAKRKPGDVSYASQSVGAGGHIAAEILRFKNGLQLNHVPYKGSAPALIDLVAGRVDFMFDALPSALPFVKDKRLRVLAIDAPKRSALLPEVPTMIELGFVGYEASPWFGLVAPAGTPKAVIDELYKELTAVLKNPGVSSRVNDMGMTMMSSSAKEFAELMKSDTNRLGAVIRAAGAKLD